MALQPVNGTMHHRQAGGISLNFSRLIQLYIHLGLLMRKLSGVLMARTDFGSILKVSAGALSGEWATNPCPSFIGSSLARHHRRWLWSVGCGRLHLRRLADCANDEPTFDLNRLLVPAASENFSTHIMWSMSNVGSSLAQYSLVSKCRASHED